MKPLQKYCFFFIYARNCVFLYYFYTFFSYPFPLCDPRCRQRSLIARRRSLFPFCCLVVTSGAAPHYVFSRWKITLSLAYIIFLLYLCAKFNLFPFCVILPFLSKKGTCRRYNRALYGLRTCRRYNRALYGLRTCRLEPYRSYNVNLELL